MVGLLSHLWQTYGPSVATLALVATLVGWRISFNAQKALLLQAKNAARAEIVKALREQEDQLAPLKGVLARLVHACPQWPLQQWEAESRKFGASLPLGSAWLERLEEYELLFPETRDVRLHLMALELDLIPALWRYRDAFASFGTHTEHVIDNAPGLLNRLDDRSAFIHDLLVFVQNATFGEFAKGSVLYRNPLDATVPRIILRRPSWFRRRFHGERPALVFLDPRRLDSGPTAQ